MKQLFSSTINCAKDSAFQCKKILSCLSGGIAVEFAVILPLFLFLLTVIIETGYIALTNSVIEGAVSTASREIRTGVIQESPDPLGRFRGTLCERVTAVIRCNLISIDVQGFVNFPDPAALADPSPVDIFNPGTADEVTLVRVSHRWNYVTPFLQELIGPGGRQHVASAVFRVEPFLQD